MFAVNVINQLGKRGDICLLNFLSSLPGVSCLSNHIATAWQPAEHPSEQPLRNLQKMLHLIESTFI